MVKIDLFYPNYSLLVELLNVRSVTLTETSRKSGNLAYFDVGIYHFMGYMPDTCRKTQTRSQVVQNKEVQ